MDSTSGTRHETAEGPGDDDLVARAGGGDERAFAMLIARHGDRIAALARRMLGPGGDVDDVVQETMLRLWTQARDWKPGGAKVSTWLYRVASNLCIDRLRRPAAAPLDVAGDPVDPGPRPDQDHAAGAAARRVDEALQALAPRQRLAIVLCHYEGLSNIDAAQAMGLSVEALESLLARGRRILKDQLAADRHWLLTALKDGGIEVGWQAENG